MQKNTLGRGLSSLLKEEAAPVHPSKYVNTVSIDDLIPGNLQPRKIFDQNKIKELADSIVSNGLIQPIIVKRLLDGKYSIIAGERRYRACKLAGITQVPVIQKNIDDKQILEIALIENIQRQELTAIEEAEAYNALIKEHGYSQADIATNLGKSRSHVANILRLNTLPQKVKDFVNEGILSMGHARCLVGVDDAVEIAGKIISNGLNVRQTEELTRRRNENDMNVSSANVKKPSAKDDDFIILGQSLSEKFGIKVVVENSWNGGKIIFHYSNLEELDSILSRIN